VPQNKSKRLFFRKLVLCCFVNIVVCSNMLMHEQYFHVNVGLRLTILYDTAPFYLFGFVSVYLLMVVLSLG